MHQVFEYLDSWCSELDLNQHGVAPTRPSSVRVYHSTTRAYICNLDTKNRARLPAKLVLETKPGTKIGTGFFIRITNPVFKHHCEVKFAYTNVYKRTRARRRISTVQVKKNS